MLDDAKRIFLLVQQYMCDHGLETSSVEQDDSSLAAFFCFDGSSEGRLDIIVSEVGDKLVRVYSHKVGFWATSCDLDLLYKSSCYLPDLEVFLKSVLQRGSVIQLARDQHYVSYSYRSYHG